MPVENTVSQDLWPYVYLAYGQIRKTFLILNFGSTNYTVLSTNYRPTLVIMHESEE